jgi:hypothetical protein
VVSLPSSNVSLSLPPLLKKLLYFNPKALKAGKSSVSSFVPRASIAAYNFVSASCLSLKDVPSKL